MSRPFSEIEALLLNKQTVQVEQAKAVLLKQTPTAWSLLWVAPWCLLPIWGEGLAKHIGINVQAFWPLCFFAAIFVVFLANVAILQRRVNALSILVMHLSPEAAA